MVRRCRVLANGRRQILSFNLPGDIFSMALNHRHSASAEADTNASVMFVERRRLLLSLADSDSGAAQALLGVMMRNHDDMQEHMLSLTRSAESRLARFPLQYSARLQCRPQLSLPMTLRDIADHLELTLETVGRTLNGLKCSGMIERAGRAKYRCAIEQHWNAWPSKHFKAGYDACETACCYAAKRVRRNQDPQMQFTRVAPDADSLEERIMQFKKITTGILTAAAALAMTAVASFAASEFEGTWKVKDTAGTAFQITLASDGSAKADREGEGMTGTWKEEGPTAIVTWSTGWTTKISKEGDGYTKSAFKKGEPLDGKPTNSSAAEKTK